MYYRDSLETREGQLSPCSNVTGEIGITGRTNSPGVGKSLPCPDKPEKEHEAQGVRKVLGT